ncbi:MAG: aminotransferase class I/II-fold pyridoxal phosphate-dependent enzyme [Tannerellaceae bacterium]|jgi:arginine/lysine/ornithine decarboxylase|nr:aminotransferase class I/II-fold pyridoxal phosphate-dependent enzyme [Tannerellaceae bacterium]
MYTKDIRVRNKDKLVELIYCCGDQYQQDLASMILGEKVMNNNESMGGEWPPLVQGLLDYANHGYFGWHMPGHHFGRSAWEPWRELLGDSVFIMDGAAELPGLDNLHDPQGIILKAEEEAASFFGAAEVRFLVNGSTQGNLAVLMGCCREGDMVFVPRNCHQSVVHGLVLSGATPIYLPVRWHSDFGLIGILQTDDLKQTLKNYQGSGGLLMLLHPNYYGMTGDLLGQVELAHQYGLQVMVDEAHGSHFCVGEQFPMPALVAGADFAVMGAHKTLGAFGQASWLHFREQGAATANVKRAMRLVETTSPSYLLLASLDVARYQLQQSQEIWQETAALGNRLRQIINSIPGLWAPGEEFLQIPEVCAYDPTRLAVKVSGLGITGIEAKKWLQQHQRMVLDMADLHYLVYILSPDDIGPMADALVNGLRALATEYESNVNKSLCSRDINELELPIPRQVITPRQAFFSQGRKIPLIESVGKIAGETITPYPPGIPLICPGEVIDNTVLECLDAWRQAGGIWSGLSSGMITVIDND